MHVRLGDLYEFDAWLSVEHAPCPASVISQKEQARLEAEENELRVEASKEEAEQVLLSHAWLTASASKNEDIAVDCLTDGRSGMIRCLRLHEIVAGGSDDTVMVEPSSVSRRYSPILAKASLSSLKGRHDREVVKTQPSVVSKTTTPAQLQDRASANSPSGESGKACDDSESGSESPPSSRIQSKFKDNIKRLATTGKVLGRVAALATKAATLQGKDHLKGTREPGEAGADGGPRG